MIQKYHLKIISGPEKGQVYILKKEVITIGRNLSNDLALSERSIEERHARIFVSQDGLAIEDINSNSGTYVNGSRIYSLTRIPLNAKIRIGQKVEIKVGEEKALSPSVGKKQTPAEDSKVLQILNGPNAGESCRLTEGKHSIGRGFNNDIVLSSSGVSGEHAMIVVKSGVISVDDIGSAAGTYVNGVKIEDACEIKPGDEIRFGTEVTCRIQPVNVPQERKAAVQVNRKRLWVGLLLAAGLILAGYVWLQNLPPDPGRRALISMQSPLDGSTLIAKRPALISAELRDTAGLSRVEVWINDEIAFAESISSRRQYQFALPWTPPLVGRYSIFLRAFNLDGEVSFSRVLEVFAGQLAYLVPPGYSLEMIAEEFGVTANAIEDANPQMICPAARDQFAVGIVALDLDHAVGQGETLASIAQDYGITEDAIRNVNPGLTEPAAPGTILVLKSVHKVVTTPTGTADTCETVQSAIDSVGKDFPEDSKVISQFSLPDAAENPYPGQYINIPPREVPVKITPPKNIPEHPYNLSFSQLPICGQALLTWDYVGPEDALAGFVIYAARPGQKWIQKIAAVGPASREAGLKFDMAGLWQIYAASKRQDGIENIIAADYQAPGCEGMEEAELGVISVPHNLRMGRSQLVSQGGLFELASRDSLAWDWQPGQGGESVIGFEIILREFLNSATYQDTVLDVVYDRLARSSAVWPSSGERICGRPAALMVRALGQEGAFSEYSDPLQLEAFPCEEDVERGGLLAYGDEIESFINDQNKFEDWVFEGKRGERVTLDITHACLEVRLGLNPIHFQCHDDAPSRNTGFTLTQDGIYTIHVMQDERGNADYQLSINGASRYQVSLNVNEIFVQDAEEGDGDEILILFAAAEVLKTGEHDTAIKGQRVASPEFEYTGRISMGAWAVKGAVEEGSYPVDGVIQLELDADKDVLFSFVLVEMDEFSRGVEISEMINNLAVDGYILPGEIGLDANTVSAWEQFETFGLKLFPGGNFLSLGAGNDLLGEWIRYFRFPINGDFSDDLIIEGIHWAKRYRYEVDFTLMIRENSE